MVAVVVAVEPHTTVSVVITALVVVRGHPQVQETVAQVGLMAIMEEASLQTMLVQVVVVLLLLAVLLHSTVRHIICTVVVTVVTEVPHL
tara:strand:- start:723 stop:989 length:267 start_codon:yes stop_codon:yes gene_type:complete